MELLKAGAESDKQDIDGHLAIQLAPDKQVRSESTTSGAVRLSQANVRIGSPIYTSEHRT